MSIFKGIVASFKEGQYFVMIKRLLLLLLLFCLMRLFFFFYNVDYFGNLSFGELLKILFYGMRFDLSIILFANSLYIILNTFPFRIKNHHIVQQIAAWYFIIVNSALIFINCIDIYYFNYNTMRSNAEIFSYVQTGDDFTNMLVQYIKDFWQVFFISAMLVWLMIKHYGSISLSGISSSLRPVFSVYNLKHLAWFLVFSSVIIIGVRGGLQLRPINIVTAGSYMGARYSALILNTPFNIMRTYGQAGLSPYNYFCDHKLDSILSPYKKFDRGSFKNENVVIVILEGFSKEYIAALNKDTDFPNYKGYTPFLDSLIISENSLVFNNSYANGRRSIDAIPAIIASIPHLMDRNYVLSSYAANSIHTLATELNSKGYKTMFMHGGTNGTMSFDCFASMAEFDEYHGRTEYGNDEHYDGHWGIFDEEFLQYSAQVINETEMPFFATIFTLSSHHPYVIPERYEDVFPHGPLQIHQGVRYADFSLKRFFETAEKMPWFDNTLFVITSDHTGQLLYPENRNQRGVYEIPVLFYKNNHNWDVVNTELPASHIDIMPTVLDYLNYDNKFISLGNSLFDTTAKRAAVTYLENIYQIIDDKYLLHFDGEKMVSLYNHKNDLFLEHNLVNDVDDEHIETLNYLKAFVQHYTNRLIKNQMHVER